MCVCAYSACTTCIEWMNKLMVKYKIERKGGRFPDMCTLYGWLVIMNRHNIHNLLK